MQLIHFQGDDDEPEADQLVEQKNRSELEFPVQDGNPAIQLVDSVEEEGSEDSNVQATVEDDQVHLSIVEQSVQPSVEDHQVNAPVQFSNADQPMPASVAEPVLQNASTEDVTDVEDLVRATVLIKCFRT